MDRQTRIMPAEATFQIFPPLKQRGIRTVLLLSAERTNEHGTQFLLLYWKQVGEHGGLTKILFCGGFWYHGSSE
jgi:hypothetical protein